MCAAKVGQIHFDALTCAFIDIIVHYTVPMGTRGDHMGSDSDSADLIGPLFCY